MVVVQRSCDSRSLNSQRMREFKANTTPIMTRVPRRTHMLFGDSMRASVLARNLFLVDSHRTVESSTRKTSGFLATLWLALALLSPMAPAQGPKPVAPKPKAKTETMPALPSTGAHEITPEDVGPFLDGIFP